MGRPAEDWAGPLPKIWQVRPLPLEIPAFSSGIADALDVAMRDRTCHCGKRRGDPEIQEEPEYTTWGWILLSMFGVTPRPHHISFRCFLCRAEVGQSRDPRLLARRSAPTPDHERQVAYQTGTK